MVSRKLKGVLSFQRNGSGAVINKVIDWEATQPGQDSRLTRLVGDFLVENPIPEGSEIEIEIRLKN